MVRGEGRGRQQVLSASSLRQDVGGHLHRMSSSQPTLRASTSSQLPPSHNRHRAGPSLTQPPLQRGGRGRGGSGGGVQGREGAVGSRDDQNSQEEAPVLSNEETQTLVAEVMRHMLFKNHQQPNIPVRREEIIQVISKSYKQRSLPNLVIRIAQERLRATFGFLMKEFARSKSLKASKAASSQVESKYYVLQSVVPEELYKKHVQTPAMAAELSLAVLVVGILKFSGGENVPEETLFRSLERMGIREGSDHPVFGNIKTALDSLAKQRYIQKEKLRGTDGEEATFAYEIAERALELPFKERLNAFTQQVGAVEGRTNREL